MLALCAVIYHVCELCGTEVIGCCWELAVLASISYLRGFRQSSILNLNISSKITRWQLISSWTNVDQRKLLKGFFFMSDLMPFCKDG